MPDTEDPCALVVKLRTAFRALITGEKATTVRITTGNGTTKEVTYAKGDIASLRGEIARLEGECAAKSGKRRRFAIVGGGSR